MAREGDRLHLVLNSQGKADLQWLANHREVPLWEAARRAFACERILAEAKARGAKIVVQVPGEPERELALI